MARGRDKVKRFLFLIMLWPALIPTLGHTGLSFQIALLDPPKSFGRDP